MHIRGYARMCAYAYICVYGCISVDMRLCAGMSAYTRTCMYMRIRVAMHMPVYAGMPAYAHISMYLRIYVYICVYRRPYACIRVYGRKRAKTDHPLAIVIPIIKLPVDPPLMAGFPQPQPPNNLLHPTDGFRDNFSSRRKAPNASFRNMRACSPMCGHACICAYMPVYAHICVHMRA